MRKLAMAWTDQQIVQQVVAQLPWCQNVTLLDKVQEDGQILVRASRHRTRLVAGHPGPPDRDKAP
jgi:hypothetical protein